MKIDRLIATGLVLIVMISFIGGIRLFLIERTKQIDLILEQEIKINQLELKIENFERCCRWAMVLEQLLPPMSQAELDLMEEQVRQGKINKNLLK